MKKASMLFILSVLFSATAVSAQNAQALPKVRFGNIETAEATIGQVLASPRVVVMNPTFIVSHFTISVLPKGGELHGPYVTQGGKLTEDEITLLKKYGTDGARIFVDDVYVKNAAMEMKAIGVIVKIKA